MSGVCGGPVERDHDCHRALLKSLRVLKLKTGSPKVTPFAVSEYGARVSSIRSQVGGIKKGNVKDGDVLLAVNGMPCRDGKAANKQLRDGKVRNNCLGAS